MEPIVVSKSAEETRITKLADEAIKEIMRHAKDGISDTDLHAPKDIGNAVKQEIDRRLTESGTRFFWLTMKKGINQYTGRVENYTTNTVYDTKYFSVRILS